MPEDLSDVETGGIELYFSDELEGETFYLRSAHVYEADEVQKETKSDVPRFGKWLPVHLADKDGQVHGTGWVVGLSELIDELQQAESDPVEFPWTVTRAEKSGEQQTDTYEVNIEIWDGLEENQSRIE